MSAYTLRYRARKLARDLARNKTIVPAEAERQAQDYAATLPDAQQAPYLRAWEQFYTAYLAACSFAEIAEASTHLDGVSTDSDREEQQIMATVRQHTCGAHVVQNWLSPAFADSLAFYDRRGFQEITHCPRCHQKLDAADLVNVRPFRQGDPANYAPEGEEAPTPSVPCAAPGCEFLILPGATYCPFHAPGGAGYQGKR